MFWPSAANCSADPFEVVLELLPPFDVLAVGVGLGRAARLGRLGLDELDGDDRPALGEVGGQLEADVTVGRG